MEAIHLDVACVRTRELRISLNYLCPTASRANCELRVAYPLASYSYLARACYLVSDRFIDTFGFPARSAWGAVTQLQDWLPSLATRDVHTASCHLLRPRRPQIWPAHAFAA